LEAQGENINNQRMLIQLVLHKFPTEVIMKVEETKPPNDIWNMKNLRAAIFRFVKVQENVYRYASNSKSLPDKPVYQASKGHYPTHNISTEVFSSISDNKSTRMVMRPCIFCKGDHYNDQCDRYKNLLDRKQKLSSEGRCFICLKPGHVVKGCPISHKRACDHCGKKGYHNRCLCPDKFPEGANMFFVSEHNKVSEVTDNLENRVPVEAEQRVSANVTHSLLVSNERVLLQTAIVPFQTFDEQTTIKARVLLDSASQRTFMTTKLAQKLKLQSEHKEYLSVSTFGAERAKGVDTYVVTFKVKVKDGSFMTLSANVLQQITGYIQRGPLLQKDLEFLRLIPQDQLADSTPSVLETTTVDVLIGSDFFWDIVGGDKVVLPSGMFMLSSKFGYIVTGKCPGGDNETQVNTINICWSNFTWISSTLFIKDI